MQTSAPHRCAKLLGGPVYPIEQSGRTYQVALDWLQSPLDRLNVLAHTPRDTEMSVAPQ